MYKEVAIDPHCFSDIQYYRLFRSEFGFEKGRYVIASARQWAREAHAIVKASESLQPVKKKSITHLLNQIQKKQAHPNLIEPIYRNCVSTECWDEWLAKQSDIAEFDLVLSDRLADKDDLDSIVEAGERWFVPPSTRILREPASILMGIAPLLRISTEIYLFDQYFVLAGNSVLAAIFGYIQNFRQLRKITLVTSIETVNPVDVFQSEYLAHFDYCPFFELAVIPERFIHDRYLISNTGAIKAGHGFSDAPEQGTQSDKVSLSLCSIAEADETLLWLNKVIDENKATITALT